MKRKVTLLALFTLFLVPGTSALADTPEQCNAYRLEMIKLKETLAQRYSERNSAIMSKDAADRARLVQSYTTDPDSLRFRTLIEKFRPDRRDLCGYWTEADGPLQ